MIPTIDPGDWFDDVVAGIVAQDYPNYSVTIVHGPGEASSFERHEDSLKNLERMEMPASAGFGTKINAAAERATEDLLLILHDDAAMEAGALAALVREFLRRGEPTSIVAAKLLDWNDPNLLMPSGFAADAFGATSSIVRPGDLDQGQHDRPSDLFGTATAATLVGRKAFLNLGGFDEAMDWHGEAHDLAVRTRATRGQIVIAPAARVRHRGAFEQRPHVGDTYRERRHQMRSVLASTPARRLPLLLAGLALLHLGEILFAIVRVDITTIASIVDAWLWNVRKAGSLVARRRRLFSLETYDSGALSLHRRRGSIRISESFDRRLAQREVAVESGEASVSAVRVAGGVSVAALLGFGARHLVTRPIPVVGEFRLLPEDHGTLTADWLSGFRLFGMGSEGFAPFAFPLLDLLGIATLGDEGLLRTLLILAPLPIGVVGIWRLFARSSARSAPAVAAAMYAASPLPYNAISNGSLTALWLFAAMPWVVSNLISIAQTRAFGLARQRSAAVVALGCIAALCVAFEPFTLVLFAMIAIGVLLGSLLSGDIRGVAAMLSGLVLAAGVSVVVNLPHLSTLREWSMFGTAQTSGATDVPLLDLLSLSTGPVGALIWGGAALVAGLLGLVSGRGVRFTWAMRFWAIMIVAWAVAWADVRGVLPVGVPPAEILLVPVAVSLASLAGIAAMVIEIDLAEAKAWRFVPAVVAIVGIAVSMVPLLDASGSGRWELAEADLTTTYGALASDPVEGSFRVIWIGDAHVLGAGAIPTANGLAWTSSFDGVPDIRAIWRGPNTGATAALTDTITAGLDGRTSRLGRELTRFGVRFVVVMDQQAPVPEVSRSEVVSDVRAAGLNAQLDLVRTGVVNPAVTVFNNTAWAPVTSAVAPDELSTLRITDPLPAVVDRVDALAFEGQTRAERDLFASFEPSAGWTLTANGVTVPRVDVGDVGIGFESSPLGAVDATLRFETSDTHRIIAFVQVAMWVLLFAIRRWVVGRAQQRARREVAIAERI